MARKTVKQKAIEHYDRMIEYAKKSEYPDSENMIYNMGHDINESTGSRNCSYCEKYNFEDSVYFTNCKNCPLGKNTDPMKFNCCNGLYIKMTEAKTTKTWIKRAEAVRQYIIDNG